MEGTRRRNNGNCCSIALSRTTIAPISGKVPILIPPSYRNDSESYWSRRESATTALTNSPANQEALVILSLLTDYLKKLAYAAVVSELVMTRL